MILSLVWRIWQIEIVDDRQCADDGTTSDTYWARELRAHEMHVGNSEYTFSPQSNWEFRSLNFWSPNWVCERGGWRMAALRCTSLSHVDDERCCRIAVNRHADETVSITFRFYLIRAFEMRPSLVGASECFNKSIINGHNSKVLPYIHRIAYACWNAGMYPKCFKTNIHIFIF